MNPAAAAAAAACGKSEGWVLMATVGWRLLCAEEPPPDTEWLLECDPLLSPTVPALAVALVAVAVAIVEPRIARALLPRPAPLLPLASACSLLLLTRSCGVHAVEGMGGRAPCIATCSMISA